MAHGVQGKAGPARVDEVTANQVAETMQALAAPSRVRILSRLREGPCSVNELVKAVGMEQSAVSHQLRLLRNLRLVVMQRQGRNSVYALHDDHVAMLLDEVVYHVEHVRIRAVTPPPPLDAAERP